MLCLVARHAKRAHSSFGDIVASARYSVFRIVTLSGQSLNLIRVERHYLAHAHMTERNAHRAEKVVGRNLAFIPIGYCVGWLCKFISLAIGERECLKLPVNMELPFRLHAIDCLVMNHTPVILEKSPVLAGDINQHRRKSIMA